MAWGEDIKAVYTERVREIYAKRVRLYQQHANDRSKRPAIEAWTACAEELVAVTYDVVRFEIEAGQATRADTKEWYIEARARLKVRHGELAALLPLLEEAVA